MTGEQCWERDSAAAPATPLPPAPLLVRCPTASPPVPLSFEPCTVSLFDLPEGVLDAIFGCLGLGDLATASCASLTFHAHCQRALGLKRELCAVHDLRLLPRQHNFLLLGAGPTSDPGATSSIGGDGGVGGASREGRDGGGSASDRLRQRVLGYVPAALHYASERCHALQRVHLELPPPPVPLLAASEAVARAVAGEPWAPAWPAALAGGQPGGNPGALADSEYPPVDGYLLKLLAQCCPGLLSVRLVNLTNNATLNRLVRPNDSCLALMGRSCPLLEELVIGHRGGEECMFNPAAPFYLEEVTDAGLRALAQHCSQLRSLGLLRCSRVGDDGLAAVAQCCRQLTSLTLHDCPGISDRGFMQVGERCTRLRVLDCTVARRAGGLLLMGEEAEQLGFRALFTIAANCPHLEELSISEEGLETPVVDDDCILCLAQGCPRVRRLALRHCGAVTDAAVRAVAVRCKQMQELILEHTAVGDAGVLHATRGLPLLRTLSIANYASSLGQLAGLPGGPAGFRGAGDAALQHVAEHCRSLRHLAIAGSRRVTDAGVRHLAARPALAAALTALSIDHTAALDGSVGELLALCTQLRALSLRGLLFSADATVERAASSCRHLSSLDLRHCSTLSDAGLAAVGRLPMLRRLQLAFCVRLTDAGLCLLAGAAPASAAFAVSRGGASSGSGHEWHTAGRAGPLFAGDSAAEELPAWPLGGCGAPGGAQDASAASGDAQDGVPRGGCALWPSLLEEVELYQVPQVTHRGVWVLAEACPHLAHVNIGKCRLVRPDALRGLLARRPLRLSVCHYLDS